MISPWTVGLCALGYMGFLFLVALWAEARTARGHSPVDNPWAYSLTLAIYCTSWTYYGSVGAAANSGYLFLTIYFGPTACIFLWWNLLRKMVRVKNRHHITSIADFVSARYDRSQKVAAIATLIVVVGMTPYIALQLKSLFTAFKIIAGNQPFLSETQIALLVVAFLSLFTIIFGARRLDPTERHNGIVAAMTVECVVKLLAFLAAGIFITYGLFDGFGDLFSRIPQTPLHLLPQTATQGSSYVIWATYMVLSMSAILFLPRQFHVAVVENSNERHILTAMWVLPLYLLLISIFVLPIAIAGLALGLSPQEADTFVLRLPMEHGGPWLTIFVFLGGFSAATGMVVVCTMTISTMITNHWLVPLSDMVKPLRFVRHNLLRCRWAAIVAGLCAGYFFERTVGESYMLINIGILSFAAMLQFAPALVGGLYWQGGNRLGALWGLWSGFLVWGYTLLVPTYMRSDGFLASEFLTHGPLGIEFLKPENLLGLTALDPLSHSVFWSLLVNTLMYIGVSLATKQRPEERRIAEEYVGILAEEASLRPTDATSFEVNLPEKIDRVRQLLLQYLPPVNCERILNECLERSQLAQKDKPSVLDLVAFYEMAENNLAGAIGAASSHRAFEKADLLSEAEREFLSRAYGGILADLKLSPQALRAKVDYYREREFFLQRISDELEAEVSERDREIAERKHVEETLRASEQRQRLLLESSPEPIASFDAKGVVTYVNPAFVNLFGWSREELLGRQLEGFIPESENKKMEKVLRDLENGKTVLNVDSFRRTKKGDLLDVQISAAPFFENEQTSGGRIVFLRDVTNQKRAEAMLRLLALAVQNSAEAVLISDSDGKIIYGNNAFLEMSGLTMSSLGDMQTVLASGAVSNKEELRTALAEQRGWKGSSTIVHKDGTEHLVECAVSPIQIAEEVSNFVAVCRDVTNERRLEEHLQRRQKLDAIGTLAGGIAHDFNNILQPMIGFTEMARERLKDDPATVVYLDRVLSTSERARSLIRQILTFARAETGKREPVSVIPLLEDIQKFLRASLPSTLDIRLDIQTKSDVILADATRLHQVVINLCTNAAHAMEGRDGVMTLALSDFDIDSAMLAKYPELEEGSYLLLSVTDTGIGMSKEILARIFEPFFTTKEKGKGTGLGLSVVHGIVRDLGGAVSVYSEEGKGSTFKVFLPKAKGVARVEEEKPREVQRGKERILFVDDEPGIRELAQGALENLGYHVTLAANGVEALARLKTDLTAFDAVITDFTMPNMTGHVLAKEIKRLRPDLPVILCTGYSTTQPADQDSGLHIDGFLSKPFTIRELSASLRKIFDRPKEGGAA